MPEILQLGPIMIKLDWLLLAISGMAGYFFMQRILKLSGHYDQPILDKLTSGLMIVFFIWKLSPVLFTPSILWQSPFSLLTMTGSLTGVFLGMLIAAWYMNRSLRRMKVSKLFFADLLTLGIATMVLVYSLLGWQYGSATSLPWGVSIENPNYKYHPVNVYLLLITLPMFIWLRRTSFSLGTGRMVLNFLMYYGMGLMIVSFFKLKTNVFYGLSAEQLIYLLMMMSGFVLSIFINRQKHQDDRSVEKP